MFNIAKNKIEGIKVINVTAEAVVKLIKNIVQNSLKMQNQKKFLLKV